MSDIKHEHMRLEDNLRKMGELEHLRSHALRSLKVCTEEEDKLFWTVTAVQAEDARRDVQHKLGEIPTEDWCPAKVAQNIRQLNYETFDGDTELFEKIERLVDSVNSHIFKQDMTGCESCKEDSDHV